MLFFLLLFLLLKLREREKKNCKKLLESLAIEGSFKMQTLRRVFYDDYEKYYETTVDDDDDDDDDDVKG